MTKQPTKKTTAKKIPKPKTPTKKRPEYLVNQDQIQNHLLIEDKSRKLVKFKLNRVQELYNQNKSYFDIILKARQEGFSSFILALFVVNGLSTPNTRTVIMSHETEATKKLLRRLRLYLERFYVGDEVIDIPLEAASQNEIIIKENNSTFYIGTAGARTFGRGDTIHQLLLSELAYYENPEGILMGIMQAVAPGGRVIIETTANGYNYFRTYWYASKSGQTTFKPHFFPWYIHHEYTLPGEITDKTPEEQEMQRLHADITDGNLLWRRAKLREFNGDIQKFNQEYPTDDHDAFISTGNTVFNTLAIDKQLKNNKRNPRAIGNVDVNGSFSTDPRGYLKIYEFPDRTKTYVIGGDTAEGIGKHDYNAAHVLEYYSAKPVAVWHGHIDPDKFGEQLNGLGKYYNNALIGCEANNHGIATNIKLRDLGYENIYQRTTFDTVSEQEINKLGWMTTAKSKPIMIAELKALIREALIKIPDERTLLELLSYQEFPSVNINSSYKRMGAPPGEHDDCVIALCIALQMRKYAAPPANALNISTNYRDSLQNGQRDRQSNIRPTRGSLQ